MDRYQRVRKIGEGAFGKAVLVRHKPTNRQCVVKEINIVKMSAKEREDSRKEVAVLAQLKHPNIVTYIESFEEAGTLYIVMNYCAGGDLYGRINNQHGRLFSEDQILTWFVQICLALKHIHDRKILHRDIKSQNIFLSSGGVVQLGDFGIAKVLNNTVELARTCIGTPYYLSPEIVENKPYNNKSDIWSLGCVLYELTTLKHAFEAGNLKNLVLKIIRGSYPPISPQYSYDLRGLIGQLFKRAPRDRPSINSVLRKNFIMDRVRKLMSAEQIEDEFSHTVMHGAKLAKALPPAPRPSSAPKKSAAPRPGSAGRGRYNPANVYGVPIGRKSQNRSSGDLKKKGGAAGGGGGNRPVPIPGQQDWMQKKKDLVDKEQKRREENKKKYEDQVARRHQNLVEKQKMDRMNKAREEGWRNLLSSDEKNEAKSQSPRNAGDARPLPMPRQKLDPPQPNLENRGPRQPGNYDDYKAYLDKLKAQRQERERELDQRREDYMAAPRPLPVDPSAPPSVQAAQAINQANIDRQKGAEAAERANIVADYMQRRQAAAANKARGQADVYGNRPQAVRGRALPTPKPAPSRPTPNQGRNKEEQEYLEKLRQIREQNMRERKNQLQQRAGIPSAAQREAEERKKKAEGLKQQAEDWARKKKEQLEKERQDLLKQQQDKLKPQQAAGNGNRPGSAKAKMTPAPAVPITGMLHLIGAGNKAAPQPAGQEDVAPAEEEAPKSVQQKKTDILKRLNEKPPSRGKWGAEKEEVSPAVEEEEVQMRRQAWGEGGVSPLADPDSARSQWSEEQIRLSDLPLEQTGSAMEATSARDKVVLNPSELEENKSARNQWGRPGSTVVKALNQLPICEGTVTLDSTGSEKDAESPTSPEVSKPAVGSTITISKAPIPTSSPASVPPSTSAPTPSPSAKPPIKSGTIVLKAADANPPASITATSSATSATTTVTTTTAATAVSAESLGVIGGKDLNAASSQPTPGTTDPLIGETELPGSNRFVAPHPEETRNNSQHHRLSTVLEASRDFSESDTASVSISLDGGQMDGKPQPGDNEQNAGDDVTDSGKPTVPVKPVLKPKPDLKPKPSVTQKPVTLPKPRLLSKPEQPFQFSGQAPVVVSSSVEDQAVFEKAPDTTATSANKGKLSTAGAELTMKAQTVQNGLSTGNFDMKNVQMLRTCSEPDLTRLFRTAVHCVKATLRRHQSLDLSQELESQQDEELSVRSLSPREEESASGSPLSPDKDEEKEEEMKDNDDNANDGSDEEEDDEEIDDDEEEDLISMRATMQSLLLDNDDDDDDDADEDGKRSPKIKFRLSSDVETTLKGENSDEQKEENDDNDDDEEESELAKQTVREQMQVKSKSDSVLNQRHGSGEDDAEDKVADRNKEGGDADNGDSYDDDVERVLYCTADILTLNDSDDETVFGDEEDEDQDLFSRLEQRREELESDLGFDKFIEVYKTVQALQEDEDENMEEAAHIAINMLGAEKQHLYPKIFQLVMADTAFTEDNA